MTSMVALAAIASSLLLSAVSAVSLDRAEFLSSQFPSATITIANTSQSPLPYAYGATVFLKTPTGWARRAGTLGHFPPVMIAPRSTFTESVVLPRCRALEAPCTQSVYLEYVIGTRADHVVLRSGVLTYTVRLDPGATFDASGVTGNRPLILDYGEASRFAPVDTLAVRLFLRPHLVSDVAFDFDAFRDRILEAFKARGVDAYQGDWSYGTPSWYDDVFIREYSANKTRVLNSVGSVSSEFAAQIENASHFVAFDFNAPASPLSSDNYFQVAYRDGLNRAETFGQLLRDEQFSVAPSNYQVPSRAGFGFIAYYPMGKPVEEIGPLNFGDPMIAPTQVYLSTPVLAAGNAPVRFSQPADATLAGPALRRPAASVSELFQPIARIASDRPELYVVGSAQSDRARALGLEPDFAALSEARSRASKLAAVLGATPQYESLYVLYPGDGATAMVGLSATLAKVAPDLWTRLGPQPGTSADSAPYDAGTLGTVPIFAPDAARLIQSHAQAHATVPPQHVRLDVYAQTSSPSLGDVRAVPALATALRSINGVRTIAVGALNWPKSIGYELILFPASELTIERAVRAVERAYRSQPVVVSAAAFPLVPECDALEARLLKESLYKNADDSHRIALATGRPIRQLLLAAALPMAVPNDGCRLTPALPSFAGNVQNWSVPEMPKPLRLSVDSYLIFRTQ